MNQPNNEYLDVSKLMGISILYPNDFYEFATVVVKMMDAYGHFQRSQGINAGIARPTVYGLARKFASTANIYFSADYVLERLKEHGLSTREILDLEELKS